MKLGSRGIEFFNHSPLNMATRMYPGNKSSTGFRSELGWHRSVRDTPAAIFLQRGLSSFRLSLVGSGGSEVAQQLVSEPASTLLRQDR